MPNNIKKAVQEALAEDRAAQALAESDKPLKTIEDLKGLSAAEVNRRWPEVSALLEADEDGGEDVDE